MLHLCNLLAKLWQIGFCISQRILQMTHQVALHLALARECGLPLTRHPLLDHVRAAIVLIFDHPIHTQGCHLRFTALRGCVHGVDNPTG
ncbi:hypothetical protein D3C78_1734820 [compost metagenome]